MKIKVFGKYVKGYGMHIYRRLIPQKAINFIAALVRYRDTVYAITPRAVIRTNWDLRF